MLYMSANIRIRLGYPDRMISSTISAKTLDDLMRLVVEALLADGDPICPSKGWAVELTGILLELSDPRARLSRTETRGKPYSCLGELCWYLAKSNELNFIEYYIPDYKKSADGDRIFGGYGPRLFNWGGLNQIANVLAVLKGKNPESRQAVVQLFDRHDIVAKYEDVPCTCTLQFMQRDGKLHMLTSMRSNDVYKGLPHDVFCFTMLQEIIARDLSVDVGSYKHAVGSLHLYSTDLESVRNFLNEGWQPTIDVAMPAMPAGDPWSGINVLLGAEQALRFGRSIREDDLRSIGPYWADLIRLLDVFQNKRNKKDSRQTRKDRVQKLRGEITSGVYHVFVDQLLSDLAE